MDIYRKNVANEKNKRIKTGILVIIVCLSLASLAIISLLPKSIEYSTPDYAKIGNPGEIVRFNFTITLKGAFKTATFKIEDVQSKWNISVNEKEFTMFFQDERTIIFSVQIPTDIKDNSAFNNSNTLSFYIVEEDSNGHSRELRQFFVFCSMGASSKEQVNETNAWHSNNGGRYSISGGSECNVYSFPLAMILLVSSIMLVADYFQTRTVDEKTRRKIYFEILLIGGILLFPFLIGAYIQWTIGDYGLFEIFKVVIEYLILYLLCVLILLYWHKKNKKTD